MFEKTYRNAAGKHFTEGRKFNMTEFLDYYNTLTDKEWDAAISMAAAKGYDISNIKPYMQICCDDFFMTDTGYDDRPIDEQRRSIEDMYALIGRPVPAYWREKLWN